MKREEEREKIIAESRSLSNLTKFIFSSFTLATKRGEKKE